MIPDLREDDLVYIIGLDMLEARVLRIDAAIDSIGIRHYNVLCQHIDGRRKYYDASQVVVINRLFRETSIQPPTLAELDSILSTLKRINEL